MYVNSKLKSITQNLNRVLSFHCIDIQIYITEHIDNVYSTWDL